MAPAGRTLYTPAMLALATRLGEYRWDETLPLRGEARSRSCGSRIELALAVEPDGRIAAIGIRPHACAVGQAAAALFVQSAQGRTAAELAESCVALTAWLAGEGDVPDWPGIKVLEPALGFPARHAAILLAWEAALVALA
jgi:NifU-like protein involved in Fe-S cluster formation